MSIYWQERRSGQRLVLELEDSEQITLGAVRETRRGFDAFATTLGYDPGRAAKGIPTMDEAKSFVLSFEPWNLYQGGEEALPVEELVRPKSE